LKVRAVLFDLDGTIYEDGVELPGASRAVAALRARGLQVGFVTNTTSRSRRHLTERLNGMGIATGPEGITTALRAGAEYLAARGHRRVAALVPPLAHEDLGEFELTAERPEAVVVGDLDDRWNFEILNTAFRQVMAGAELVALSVDRYWQHGDGLVLDSGPFVKALEYASGRSATVCGKPSAGFYRMALGTLGPWAIEDPGSVLMVGDDVWGDVRGAQEAGLKACLVRTGKYREEVFKSCGVTPDEMIDAIAELDDLF